jgi:hypothetical protein
MDDGIISGVFIGVIFCAFWACIVANVVEDSKTKQGYLTYERKIYKVELVGPIENNSSYMIEQCKPKEQD